jgi:uncharacterized delta-60 repeat protein
MHLQPRWPSSSRRSPDAAAEETTIVRSRPHRDADAAAAARDAGSKLRDGGFRRHGFSRHPNLRHGVCHRVQPDQKIVTAGYSSPLDGLPEFAVARYLSDGTLDPTLAGVGRVVVDVGTAGIASAVAVGADGTVVVGGAVTEGIGLLRFGPDGRTDVTFGHDGVVLSPTTSFATVAGIAIADDGTVLVAGVVFVDLVSEVGLMRYRADGTLDPRFGDQGVVTTPVGVDMAVHAFVVQPDGRILVGGSGSTDATNGAGVFLLARYLPDGTLDAGFGEGGIVRTDVTPGERSRIVALSLGADGEILALGPGAVPPRASREGGALYLARYRSDGALDTSFGIDGIVAAAIGINEGAPIVVQADGKILVGDGLRFTGAASVQRLAADGTVDTDFGDGGTFAMHARPDDDSALLAFAIQSDGRLVGAGYSRPPMGSADFALTRVWVGGP